MKIASRVIAKFKVMFPGFAGQLLNDHEATSLMLDEWARALSGIDPLAIKSALEQLRDSGGKWPPSLPEFLALCQPRKAACHQPFLPKPEKKVNKALANRHLNELRAILRR